MGEILSVETLSASTILARADAATLKRGQAYHKQGRAHMTHFEPAQAVYQVEGQETYTVKVSLRHGSIGLHCNCYMAGDEDEPCKHCVAVLIALNTYLSLHPPMTDDTNAFAPAPARKGAQAVLLFSVQPIGTQWTVVPCTIATTHFPPDTDTADTEDAARAIAAHNLGNEARPLRSMGNTARFVNSSDQSLRALKQAIPDPDILYLHGSNVSDMGELLGLLHGCLVYQGTAHRPCLQRLMVERAAGQPELHVEETADGGLHLRAQVRVGSEVLALAPDTIERVAGSPPWLLLGSRLVALHDPDSAFAVFLQTPELFVPPAQKDAFLSRYLLPLADRFPLLGMSVAPGVVHGGPVPRLYLTEEDGEMQAALRFGYGDYEVGGAREPHTDTLCHNPGTKMLARVHRQPQQEGHWQQLLLEYGLKRGGSDGVFTLRAKVDVRDFLATLLPALANAGVEIYGDADLPSVRINRSKPSLSLRVKSGIDWFDVEAVVAFGDLEATLHDLRRALRKRERFIKLADGSLGVIPDEWMERYKFLFGLAEETAQGLRIGAGQVALLEQLEAQGDTLEADAEFQRRRERLRGLAGVAPQPLPQHLGGALRPYQKAGFDWLHFLHDTGFGGCLADDMGTGKTFTTLAFLQSLKERAAEQGEAPQPSLLVLPRSLVFNWEREAAQWTPHLRLLNWAGAERAKDPAMFADYDLVITTYGLLLRDWETLRKCSFHYVILDEAQAIKNPQSQTGRAARALQSAHRLSLTGTPVENSASELWAQFAFLSPSLLGSYSSFAKEFAVPIEKHSDERAASLLRALVHPFILRRTKAQVAPELPPRTERVVYTDMEPAQRKLYEQKRDEYRAHLLGLLDTEGIDKARMHVLEGLLRLRQIACHPRLAVPATRAGSGKFEALLDTLDTLRAEGHKALVFSQFVGMLALVQEALDARAIPYAYLDGSTQDRQARVDAFQNTPDLPFFLISLKAGGVGLNLTAADYVIHIDPWWNPAVEMQATDRAHRIGQQRPVFVSKLIAQDTVEEKILVLQERKRALMSQLVTTEAGFFKSLTRDDVLGLFE